MQNEAEFFRFSKPGSRIGTKKWNGKEVDSSCRFWFVWERLWKDFRAGYMPCSCKTVLKKEGEQQSTGCFCSSFCVPRRSGKQGEERSPCGKSSTCCAAYFHLVAFQKLIYNVWNLEGLQTVWYELDGSDVEGFKESDVQ